MLMMFSGVQPSQQKLPSMDEIDPCMRLIVQQTDLEKLRIGTLFIVTCTGGTLGREVTYYRKFEI